MQRSLHISILIVVAASCALASINDDGEEAYRAYYSAQFDAFRTAQASLINTIEHADLSKPDEVSTIQEQINAARSRMKSVDFWMRYLGPLPYKQINGPLPVEWETEVFEKYEKPYKREGAGLTLAALYLEEPDATKEELLRLVNACARATEAFSADSITEHVSKLDHFFLCNRLFLLNLAAIYTTGFECPDTARVIPELRAMLSDVNGIYAAFDRSFPSVALPTDYHTLYERMIAFTNAQPASYSRFDHFTFIRDFVDPLFAMNQQFIRDHHVFSRSYMDYSLSKRCTSIFGKDVYMGQEAKGVFRRVEDPKVLAEIDHLGKLLFYDPILSANDQRSCASCHKPSEFFTDTAVATAPSFDHQGTLPRNTPTLLNASYNHLMMLDGRHIDLQAQAHGVIGSATEMGGCEADILKKVMSCPDYREAFDKLLKHTPEQREVTMDHVVSAVTFYYNKFSSKHAPFDQAMDAHAPIDPGVQRGFNLFMSKAQCATCHFVPQFNGVKPPFIGSEFEVIGVPEDSTYHALSDDQGRYVVNPAEETMHAFRTGSLRNITHTGPYMHNGVFTSLRQVMDFYNNGGGAGKHLDVPNQTLSADPLKLTQQEKDQVIAFLGSLTEDITSDGAPAALPRSKIKTLNTRKPGGEY